MEEKKESLEERAKKFIKLIIAKEPEKLRLTFYIEDFEEDIPALNYLVEQGYSLEKGFTAGEFHYELTPYGKKWALDKN
jgi:hypothetical protein